MKTTTKTEGTKYVYAGITAIALCVVGLVSMDVSKQHIAQHTPDEVVARTASVEGNQFLLFPSQDQGRSLVSSSDEYLDGIPCADVDGDGEADFSRHSISLGVVSEEFQIFLDEQYENDCNCVSSLPIFTHEEMLEAVQEHTNFFAQYIINGEVHNSHYLPLELCPDGRLLTEEDDNGSWFLHMIGTCEGLETFNLISHSTNDVAYSFDLSNFISLCEEGGEECTQDTECTSGNCEETLVGSCVSGDYGEKASCPGFTTEDACLGFQQNVGPNGELVSVCAWEEEMIGICAPLCGNGIVEEGEECDGSDPKTGLYCTSDCTLGIAPGDPTDGGVIIKDDTTERTTDTHIPVKGMSDGPVRGDSEILVPTRYRR